MVNYVNYRKRQFTKRQATFNLETKPNRVRYEIRLVKRSSLSHASQAGGARISIRRMLSLPERAPKSLNFSFLFL